MTHQMVFAASEDYPLLNVFWTMLWLFIWILWIFLLFRIITDIFRSRDLGGWGKAAWTIFVILLPFLGVFCYLIARGSSMHDRELGEAKQNEQALRTYIQETAASGTSTSDELTKLAALRDKGVLTDAEFNEQKQRLLHAA